MITTEEIIATLILKGFAPRDKSRDYIDFYHTDVWLESREYNWGIIFDPSDNSAYVSDSQGWMPFNQVISTKEDLNKAISDYTDQVKLGNKRFEAESDYSKNHPIKL
jgi:hypothetical protein